MQLTFTEGYFARCSSLAQATFLADATIRFLKIPLPHKLYSLAMASHPCYRRRIRYSEYDVYQQGDTKSAR